MKHLSTWVRLGLVAAAAGITLTSVAQASTVIRDGSLVSPAIVAGAPPDSPANRVDPNVAASPFSGVVSINIRYDGLSFICSGAMVSSRHVVTAGHCVDTNGQGAVIDITKPGNDVRAVFNAGPAPGNAVITATAVNMHPDYKGFGVCPPGVNSFCVNDDLAVLTLGQDAPASAKIYSAFNGIVDSGTQIKMVGYGRSGDGLNGYTVGANFRIKRQGGNVIDVFDGDDEQNFTGPREVWYADFDGNDALGVNKDLFCTELSVCTPQLANDVEAALGGGDSGGPSFIEYDGQWLLVANNTFSGRWNANDIGGTFGTYMGGILLNSHFDFIEAATGGLLNRIPAPGSLVLVLLAGGVALTRRRSAPQQA